MTELESRLSAALGEDAPPARDALFRVEVLMRRERARFRRQVTQIVAAVLGVSILAALNAQALAAWAGADPARLAMLASGTAAAVLVFTGAPLAGRAGVRTIAQRVERWFFA